MLSYEVALKKLSHHANLIEAKEKDRSTLGLWSKPYRNLLRITTASTVSMINHVQIATPTLKKETPIESKKMAGIMRPRSRKKRTVAGSWGSSSSRLVLVEYQWMAVKSSLPTASVAA